MLSERARTEIDAWVKKYPDNQKQSAVMAALRIAQEENAGWLPQEAMDDVADYLGMPRIAVYEAASFYSMYNLKPIGRWQVDVCTNIACMLNGSDEIVKSIQERYGVGLGETSANGQFTFKEVECLGACGGAPVCQIGRQYHEHLTKEKLAAILDGLEQVS